jgi:hypothetical protein
VKLIVSIYDRTGNWAEPYARNGYQVLLWDLAFEGCILKRFGTLCDRIRGLGLPVYGLLAAPPCTLFCRAGARWRRRNDRRRSREYEGWTLLQIAKAQVLIVLHLVELFKPAFWAIENPFYGRLEKLIPELRGLRRLVFDPCDFGDPYTKRTALYGEFNARLSQQPCLFTFSDFIHHLPSSSPKRSVTPRGFADAFFAANL